ncbi:5-oxoprolinase subunit PxpB [Sphingobacterium prati]|uniref:5-oxoprolinase subunit PxpB n=1 Tax=Sphingobacterium prati TaxID=2737006 RepID=UPI0015531029|nr:5-oxoprolinase subunit PxpB [Sphingobacterium prati]NPE45577.1 5-oxoprolinase subunit PxpB [Sphingobacterium prati]
MGIPHTQSFGITLPNSIGHYPLGDQALVLSFGDTISEAVNARVRQVATHIENWSQPGIIEYVPAYTTITIYYDPLLTSYNDLLSALQPIVRDIAENQEYKRVKKEIPVYYNGEDLAYVAQYNGLSEDEVVRIHSEGEYLVHMLGFVPGFPYLGGMDKRIATPRKDVPRLRIEAGAVGIAGQQTGVYPMTTPGGWQIIGHTPLQLFDLSKESPSLLEMGDCVRFVPITYDEFIQLKTKSNGH